MIIEQELVKDFFFDFLSLNISSVSNNFLKHYKCPIDFYDWYVLKKKNLYTESAIKGILIHSVYEKLFDDKEIKEVKNYHIEHKFKESVNDLIEWYNTNKSNISFTFDFEKYILSQVENLEAELKDRQIISEFINWIKNYELNKDRFIVIPELILYLPSVIFIGKIAKSLTIRPDLIVFDKLKQNLFVFDLKSGSIVDSSTLQAQLTMYSFFILKSFNNESVIIYDKYKNDYIKTSFGNYLELDNNDKIKRILAYGVYPIVNKKPSVVKVLDLFNENNDTLEKLENSFRKHYVEPINKIYGEQNKNYLGIEIVKNNNYTISDNILTYLLNKYEKLDENKKKLAKLLIEYDKDKLSSKIDFDFDSYVNEVVDKYINVYNQFRYDKDKKNTLLLFDGICRYCPYKLKCKRIWR
jgi:hypothetical protein